jgi:hypothetical protein
MEWEISSYVENEGLWKLISEVESAYSKAKEAECKWMWKSYYLKEELEIKEI